MEYDCFINGKGYFKDTYSNKREFFAKFFEQLIKSDNTLSVKECLDMLQSGIDYGNYIVVETQLQDGTFDDKTEVILYSRAEF